MSGQHTETWTGALVSVLWYSVVASIFTFVYSMSGTAIEGNIMWPVFFVIAFIGSWVRKPW